MKESRSISPMMHLDLNNFDSPEAELSRYVLTSPRSLESCAKLGVKPIDLLFKKFTEFMEEHQDTPVEVLTAMYEVHEKERREHLWLCLEERQRIIQEGKDPVPMKPFSGLETVLEQASDSQSTDSKARCQSEQVQIGKSQSVVGFAQDFPKPPSQLKPLHSSQPLPCSHSLGDLRHSPATARRLGRIRQDIYRKLNVTVPEKDCRIVGLMLVKQEEEQARLLQSQLEELRHEEVRRKEAALRALAERRRRKELLHSLHCWHKDIEARRRRREKEKAEKARQQNYESLEQVERWRRHAEEQEVQRRVHLETVKRETEERRRRQGKQLEEIHRREQVERTQEHELTEVREHQAKRSKSRMERKKQQRLREENQRKQLHHSLLKWQAEEKLQSEKEVKRHVLERRLQQTTEKHAQMLEARWGELRERAKREEAHARRAQLRAGREQKERQEEKEVLAQLSWRRAKEAQRCLEENIRIRAQQVRRENLEKATSHRRLRERVLKEEEVQQEQRKNALALKEQHREQLRKEREEALERSRKVANASSCMREMVREQCRSRTFQQMALQAELTAYLSRLKL